MFLWSTITIFYFQILILSSLFICCLDANKEKQDALDRQRNDLDLHVWSYYFNLHIINYKCCLSISSTHFLNPDIELNFLFDFILQHKENMTALDNKIKQLEKSVRF